MEKIQSIIESEKEKIKNLESELSFWFGLDDVQCAYLDDQIDVCHSNIKHLSKVKDAVVSPRVN